jgi:hypothetical protein
MRISDFRFPNYTNPAHIWIREAENDQLRALNPNREGEEKGCTLERKLNAARAPTSKGPSSLFILSERNFLRRATRFLIE